MSHIFCAVVGAGVLGLPYSVAWLGWIAGPLCLIVFFSISMWSSHLLAQLYCINGVEFARYHHAVKYILVCGGWGGGGLGGWGGGSLEWGWRSSASGGQGA